MSVVTTVVVVLGYDHAGETLRAISEFTGTSQNVPLTFGTPIDPCGEHVGGYKCAECDVHIGAFNHFDWTGFQIHLATKVPWLSPEDSCVVLQSSDLQNLMVFRPSGETTHG